MSIINFNDDYPAISEYNQDHKDEVYSALNALVSEHMSERALAKITSNES
jgi:DnaJ-domain-containing protein 1